MTMSPDDADHIVDLSGADPTIRALFFLFVAGAVICGFLVVLKFGRREETYIHPLIKRLIDAVFRKKQGHSCEEEKDSWMPPGGAPVLGKKIFLPYWGSYWDCLLLL